MTNEEINCVAGLERDLAAARERIRIAKDFEAVTVRCLTGLRDKIAALEAERDLLNALLDNDSAAREVKASRAREGTLREMVSRLCESYSAMLRSEARAALAAAEETLVPPPALNAPAVLSGRGDGGTQAQAAAPPNQ